MNNTADHIDDLIAGYLAGEASPAQVEAVERWREASEENARYFENMRIIFEKASTFRESVSFDTDEAWKRLRARMASQQKVVPMSRPTQPFFFLRVAAGIALFIAAGIFGYRFFSSDRNAAVEYVAVAETRADTLPDGSQVFLNRNTTLAFAVDRRSHTRMATLSGEAYFEVADLEAEFLVAAGETLIKDIGTSFNVRAYPDSSTVEVFVEEGEVLFYTANDPGIRLKAGDKGVYRKATGAFVISEPELNITAYKTLSFTFEGHSLGAVVRVLNEVYQTRLTIDEHLADCKLTVRFEGERIEEIAQVIAETLGLTVSERQGVIHLQGQGCGEAPSP